MKRVGARIVGGFIDAVDWNGAIGCIKAWAYVRQSKYVCICNAHSVVTARTNADFARVIDGADMATPDGAPVAWMLRKLGFQDQARINGPDLMWRYFSCADTTKERVFLYGGSEGTLNLLKAKIQQEFPSLKVVGVISPPFRSLTDDEDDAFVRQIESSGATTVWVSLGCPKQEAWMAEHRGRVNAVMIGVGAAFDYHAGTLRRAPEWMRDRGLEWLYRLATEPRRLWRRYVVTNSLFIYFAANQLVDRAIASKGD